MPTIYENARLGRKVNFAPGKILSEGKSQRKCIYSVAAQETAKHHATFGWPPVRDVAAVTKARRETRQHISAVNGPSSPHYADMWRTYCCLTSFFPIVDTCLRCEDIARQSCAMVRRWRLFLVILRPVFQRAACSTFQTCSG